MPKDDIYIDRDALDRVDRKLKADSQVQGMESSWKNQGSEAIEMGPMGPISNPGPRVPWYKRNKPVVRQETHTVSSAIEVPKTTFRVEPQAPENKNIFSFNRMSESDEFLWLKNAPTGWADVVFVMPPFWKDHGDAWSQELGHEKTIYEYNGRLFSLASEISRMMRPTGEMWFLQEDRFAFKLKEFDLKTIDVYRPSQGSHLLARYAKSKKKSIAIPEPKLVGVEGFHSFVLDCAVPESILKQVGQAGSSVLSLFAGPGHICRSAKALGMFYIGVDSKRSGDHWNDL